MKQRATTFRVSPDLSVGRKKMHRRGSKHLCHPEIEMAWWLDRISSCTERLRNEVQQVSHVFQVSPPPIAKKRETDQNQKSRHSRSCFRQSVPMTVALVFLCGPPRKNWRKTRDNLPSRKKTSIFNSFDFDPPIH